MVGVSHAMVRKLGRPRVSPSPRGLYRLSVREYPTECCVMRYVLAPPLATRIVRRVASWHWLPITPGRCATWPQIGLLPAPAVQPEAETGSSGVDFGACILARRRRHFSSSTRTLSPRGESNSAPDVLSLSGDARSNQRAATIRGVHAVRGRTSKPIPVPRTRRMIHPVGLHMLPAAHRHAAGTPPNEVQELTARHSRGRASN